MVLPKGSIDVASAAAARPKSMALGANAGLASMMEQLRKKQEERQTNTSSIDDKLAEDKKKREEAAAASASAKGIDGQTLTSSGSFKKPAATNIGWTNELRDKLRDKSTASPVAQVQQQEQSVLASATKQAVQE